MSQKERRQHEYGDFQTPAALAAEVCRFLAARGVRPAAVVEPSCGLGSFLFAALDRFPNADALGVETNRAYVETLRSALAARAGRSQVACKNVFEVDWPATLGKLPEPILVLGNPPWVTNAQLGALGSSNLPVKSNLPKHAGLDALTGKSNFDLSEWLLIQLLEALAGRRAWLALLCKLAVARKALAYAWRSGIPVDWAEVRRIDARASFGAAVEACLLACALAPTGRSVECRVYDDFDAQVSSHGIGWRDGQVVADVPAYERWKHLVGNGSSSWRSGVKHDCAQVMELRRGPHGYVNGFGELVKLEDRYLYPMRKSSEVANGRLADPVRWMLVPQRTVGEDTGAIQAHAPRTWDYLVRHGAALDRRRSTIYRNRPRFSVFGVGDYTFAPWKVAISGFYKRLMFRVVGSPGGKPTVFDDTVYFLACQGEDEARRVAALLNSDVAKAFYAAFLFWDAKRPITAELLRRLDLRKLDREMGEPCLPRECPASWKGAAPGDRAPGCGG